MEENEIQGIVTPMTLFRLSSNIHLRSGKVETNMITDLDLFKENISSSFYHNIDYFKFYVESEIQNEKLLGSQV